MMGEATIDPKASEDAMLKASPTLLPSLLGTASDPAAEFYHKFQRIAEDRDRDFVRKYDEDLNITLIFAGLFSAVTSAFIINVQSKLEPDFEEMNHALLKIVASAALGNIPTGADAAFPEWNGPDSTVVHVQAILYSSLSASLLAAFVAMLGKQWLNRYASVEGGTVIDRGRQRKRKMEGMVTWRFGLVMECLPLMLQVALLLLGCALSDYLFFINKAVASVVIGFTTLGFLFYFLIVSAATLSYNCPFQTPLSLILRFLIRFDNEHKKYLKKSRRKFRKLFSRIKRRRQRPTPGGPYGVDGFDTPSRDSFDAPDLDGLGDHTELTVTGLLDEPIPIFDHEIQWDIQALDANCIIWMFGMSMDMDTTTIIAGFIPEIIWYGDTQDIPLERLYNTVLKCFDLSSGRPILKPALRDHAYLNAKALVHVGIRRRCTDDVSGDDAFQSIRNRHKPIEFGHYEGDSDLESALSMIGRVFGNFGSIDWQDLSFTVPHHAWMGYVLLYRASDLHAKGKPVPDYIKEFVRRSSRLEPTPPASIVADCLFIVGLVLGIEPRRDHLVVTDKHKGADGIIDAIYKRLVDTFWNPATADEIDRALEAMKLIDPLIEDNVASQSSYLFHIVMQSPVLPSFPEKKWEISRLAMRGAYKWSGPLPPVEDLPDILTFLEHHFGSATRDGQNQEEPIQHAFCALGFASGPASIEALERFDVTVPWLIRCIHYALQGERPSRLRMAALSFLPFVGDRWFNAPNPITSPDQIRDLCVDWASAVDGDIEATDGPPPSTLAVLFGMVNSPHWRPHIVKEKWKLLEHFTLVPDDSQPLRKCIDNPELMDTIRNEEGPATMAAWLAILWYKHEELIPQVREKLERIMMEVVQDQLDMGLAVMDAELGRVRDALKRLEEANAGLSVDVYGADLTLTLRARIRKLEEARAPFIAPNGG